METAKRFLNKNKFLLIVLSILVLFICFLFVIFHKRIIFNGSKNIEIVEFQSDYIPDNISACYGNMFKCDSIDVEVHNGVDVSSLGEYEVLYTASYKGHKKNFRKRVSVVDRSKPIINISNDIVSVCPNSDNYNVLYTAYDNYDGDITSSVQSSIEGDSLILTVFDSSLNSDSKSILLKREDLVAPSIDLIENRTMYMPVGTNFSDPGYTSIDNCDGDLSDKVLVSGSVDTNTPGNYDLTYSITDSSGNSNSITRTIIVYSPNQNGDKVIYLTFDDGPSQYTGELLNVLAKYDVKATFFVTGMNPKYFDFIGEAYRQGHSIGLHTSSHNYSLVYSSVDAFLNDINSINEVVKNQTGSYSNIIRFPGGSSNTVSRFNPGIMTQLSRIVEEKGFKYFDWNVSSGDASSTVMSSDVYANNIINGLGNGSYYIVLQHDTNINSIRAVSNVIEYGLAHGYSFKTLDFDSPVVHHRIAN